ncbi:unnamed protein product [Phaeothamnion confervicola]
MNAAFRGAAAQYQQVPPKLSHAQVVCRLYRHSLKLLDSWVIDRRIFNQEATKMRAQFNAAKGEAPDSGKVKRLLREGHEMLASYAHPDRYIKPYMPSGSLYMRNPAPPLHVCFPLGIPNHVLKEVST